MADPVRAPRRRAGGSFLGRGWAFPPEFERVRGSVKMVSDLEDIEQSLRILLSTRKGERLMRPTYGCGIHQLVFAPLHEATIAEIRGAVERAILFFEPRIRVDRIDVLTSEAAEGHLLIEIDYTVRATNTRSNMVYPFYFREGTQLQG